MRKIKSLPIPVKKALLKLGNDISDARKRRRIPMALLAERAGISRTTLTKIENGDASVAFGLYAKVLFALGLIERISNLADVRNDELGLMLDEEQLPKRVRLSQPKDRGDI